MTDLIDRLEYKSQHRNLSEYKTPKTIPDLWHVAMFLEEQSKHKRGADKKQLELYAAMVLDCWHMMHDARRYIDQTSPVTEQAA